MLIGIGFVLGVVFLGLLVMAVMGGLGNSPLTYTLSIVGAVLIVVFVIGNALGINLSWG